MPASVPGQQDCAGECPGGPGRLAWDGVVTHTHYTLGSAVCQRTEGMRHHPLGRRGALVYHPEPQTRSSRSGGPCVWRPDPDAAGIPAPGHAHLLPALHASPDGRRAAGVFALRILVVQSQWIVKGQESTCARAASGPSSAEGRREGPAPAAAPRSPVRPVASLAWRCCWGGGGLKLPARPSTASSPALGPETRCNPGPQSQVAAASSARVAVTARKTGDGDSGCAL